MEASQASEAGSIPVARSNRTLIWMQSIRVSVLRFFPGIPGFLGLPAAAGGCLLVGLRGPARVLRPVSGTAVNSASKGIAVIDHHSPSLVCASFGMVRVNVRARLADTAPVILPASEELASLWHRSSQMNRHYLRVETELNHIVKPRVSDEVSSLIEWRNTLHMSKCGVAARCHHPTLAAYRSHRFPSLEVCHLG